MRNSRSYPVLVLFGIFSFVAACSVVGPDEREIVGVIQVEGVLPVVVAVPDTVQAGVPFTVELTTYKQVLSEELCVTRGARTTVSQTGLHATVTPYDSAAPLENGCTFDLRRFAHTAEIVFDSPGTATITFKGRLTRKGANVATPELITVERRVVVE